MGPLAASSGVRWAPPSGLNFKIAQAKRPGLTASEPQEAGNPVPNLKTQNDVRGADGALPVKTNSTAC